jgi:hypothetical protein
MSSEKDMWGKRLLIDWEKMLFMSGQNYCSQHWEFVVRSNLVVINEMSLFHLIISHFNSSTWLGRIITLMYWFSKKNSLISLIFFLK